MVICNTQWNDEKNEVQNAASHLTNDRTFCNNLERSVAGVMTSHHLLVGAWQQKLKPVLVSCCKILVQLQHATNMLAWC